MNTFWIRILLRTNKPPWKDPKLIRTGCAGCLCFIGAMAFHMILDPVWNNFAIWVEPLALIWVIFRGKDPDHDFEKSKCNQTVILLLRSHFKAISAWYSLWHLHIFQVPTVTVTVTDMFPFYYTTGHVFWCFLQICFIHSLFQLVFAKCISGGKTDWQLTTSLLSPKLERFRKILLLDLFRLNTWDFSVCKNTNCCKLMQFFMHFDSDVLFFAPAYFRSSNKSSY